MHYALTHHIRLPHWCVCVQFPYDGPNAHKCTLFQYFCHPKKKNEREPMRFVWESKEKQDRHQMFTIQIFCSYSINYKSFKLICSENNVSHFFPELSTAGQYYSVRNERANRKKERIACILSQFIWWLVTVLLQFFLICAREYVLHANLGVHFAIHP